MISVYANLQSHTPLYGRQNKLGFQSEIEPGTSDFYKLMCASLSVALKMMENIGV